VAAIVMTAADRPTWACSLVVLAAILDLLDGTAARMQGGGSALGKQLDSLADLISFGVAPGMMVFFQASLFNCKDGSISITLLLSAIVITLASAWRLAKFNIDERQTSGFLGLPTPAHGLFWVSMVAIANGIAVPGAGNDLAGLVDEYYFHAGLPVFITALVLGYLMLSEIPLPSLKFRSSGWKDNEVQIVLLVLGGILLLIWQAMAVPLILFLYLLSPLWGRIFSSRA